VIRPSFRAPRGLPRLRSLVDHWIRYSQKKVFRGGCFFAAAATEFDSRPGPVRNRVADAMREWMTALETAVKKAIEAGDIAPDVDPRQVAFELNALVTAANTGSELFDDRKAWRRARKAVEHVFDRLPRPRKAAAS